MWTARVGAMLGWIFVGLSVAFIGSIFLGPA